MRRLRHSGHPERHRSHAGGARLTGRGLPVKHDDLATLSLYQTRHIKRFGDYVFTVTTPEPFDGELVTLLSRDGSAEHAAIA